MKSKILTGLASVFVALCLWLYVITVVSPGYEKTFYNIPVVVVNESLLTERNLVIVENKDTMVTLHLVGNRIDLNKLNSSNITVTVDASRIYEARNHEMSYSITYPGDIADDAVTVQSRNPSTITLQVAERTSKTVEVVVEYTGSLPENFVCDKENAVLTNQVITIAGPKADIDRITQAKIRVNLDGRKESISQSFEYVLTDAVGEEVDKRLIVADVNTVGLSVKIQKMKEVPVHLQIINGGGATDKNVKIDPVSILVSGSESILDQFTSLDVGSINLSEYLEDTVLTFPIVLPEGVINETGITEVTVELTFPGLVTKKINVTNIQTVNVPAGLKESLITQKLEITLRGPQYLISRIRSSDIIAQVDFSGLQAGTVKVKPNIIVSESYSGVGAVGVYSVSATLRE